MNTLNDTMDAAKDLMDSAKGGTQHAVSSARSTLFDGIHAMSSVVSMLRGLGIGDALGWVGLERRRSPLSSIAAFGAGIAVGAGVGMLFAPRSGAQTRRAIFKALKGAEEKAEAEAKDLEQQAEDLVGKAKDAVMKTERKVETKVTDGMSAAKDAIKTKAEDAAGAVKETLDDAKSALASADPFRSMDSKSGETKTTTKPQTAGGNHRAS